jgi:hypothetical protein
MRSFVMFICVMCVAFVASAEVVELPNSSVVVVKTMDTISASEYASGQEVVLVVAADVRINGKVLIAAGAPAFGFIEEAKGSGMAGIAGKLSLSINSATAVDGTIVQVTGKMLSQGDSEVGGTVAVGVILCPLALLNKGEDGALPVGAQARAMTVGAYQIEVE